MRMIELDRINELAQIARTVGLDAKQTQERTDLRAAYLRKMKGQMTNMLATVTVLDPLGQDVTPLKLRAHQWAGLIPQVSE